MVMTVEELGMAILTKGMKDHDDGYIQITVIPAENGKFKLYLRDNAWKFNPFEMETNVRIQRMRSSWIRWESSF